ncbi:MAG: nucleotidyltransferase domain-containing protein [Chloroflexi bacterium]|nr:nucleotidyltransferase domain-containing protein [Chloroflexota bacterium]
MSTTTTLHRTVSELTPAELELYRQALRKRKRVKCQAPERLKRARKVARRAAKILKEEFGVAKVVLFGSTVKPSLFHIHSDVDLAVWGLDENLYFRAVGVLLSIDPEISVDLIELEFASPRMKETILRDGKPLL